MDAVVAFSHTVFQAFNSNGSFGIRLSDGAILEGPVHQAWGSQAQLLGRTLDLTAAYKQLAVSPSEFCEGPCCF